jgi:GNAT superfamily N-acetyltransferase
MPPAKLSEDVVDTDKAQLDLDRIHRWLSVESYWAQGRTRDEVERSLANSAVSGAYRGVEQVGFARAVTDAATFAWLCVVFVDSAHRGRRVGKLLVHAAVEYADCTGLGITAPATRDAQDLYARCGGSHSVEQPERWMVRRASDGSPPCAR